jgi:hypothetical protein
MELVPQDALLFIVSYLKGRREPEVRSALVDAVAAAYDRRLELPDWVLDLLGDDGEDARGERLLQLFGHA